MKRIIIAIVLLVITAWLCAFEYALNTTESKRTSESLEKAQNLVNDGKTEEAEKVMDNLKKNWENNVESMLIFISHNKPDEICESLAVAESYLKNREFPEFYAECKRAENELKHFRDLEIPTFNNIL